MNLNIKQILISVLQLKFFILLIAFLDFVWYFFHSKAAEKNVSDAITFCASCPWYYDGADAGKPFILLFATLFMVYDRWWCYLIAAVISGYEVIEGIIWISSGTGFVGGLSERIDLISRDFDLMVWRYLDWQYLLALIIFIVALGYLIVNIIKTKQNHLTS